MPLSVLNPFRIRSRKARHYCVLPALVRPRDWSEPEQIVTPHFRVSVKFLPDAKSARERYTVKVSSSGQA